MSRYNDDWRNESGPRVVDAEVVDQDVPGGNGSGRSQANSFYRRSGVWTYSPVDTGGCLAPCISIMLFLVCLGQYGLLAAIGFFVFHLIGSIMGSVYAARQLMSGISVNPWTWRTGNWIISFLLTVWLAGGLG